MTNRATHTDYLHPGHLRVVDGNTYLAWNAVNGFFDRAALCVPPHSNFYQETKRPNLPKWPGGVVVNGVEVPRD